MHAHPHFSPDGTRLACARHQRRDGALGPSELVIYDLESDRVDIVGGDWIDGPELRPCGPQVLVFIGIPSESDTVEGHCGLQSG